MLATEPLSQLRGAAGRSSLWPSCTPPLPLSTPCPPPCACRPGPGFTLQSGLCFSWPAPWPNPAPRPQRPRCSQTATGQAWGGSQGQGGPPLPPRMGVGRQLEPVVPAQVPSASLEWPSAGGVAFPPALLPHESLNHTQAEPHQLPPAPHRKSEPLLLTGGHCTDHPPGGAERVQAALRQASGHSGLGGAVLCSQDAHPLWSWQAALRQGGRKRARQRQPRFLPQRGLQERRPSRAAFICLLLAASLLTSARHCLLANRTRLRDLPPLCRPGSGTFLGASPDEHTESKSGGALKSGCLSTPPSSQPCLCY